MANFQKKLRASLFHFGHMTCAGAWGAGGTQKDRDKRSGPFLFI